MARNLVLAPFFLLFFFLSIPLLLSSAFESDELLLQDDEEFGLEGGVTRRAHPDDVHYSTPVRPSRRSSDPSDSKSVHFSLEQAFGDYDEFAHAGTFTARLKSSPHGGQQTLTKLRFSRDEFTGKEKEAFERVLKEDGFYKIRLPSNVLSPPGRDYVVASVRARCLLRGSLDEHVIIHMDGVNILAVSYGSSGSCQYPRLLKFPTKWSFNSYTILKNSEQARRTPTFIEEMVAAENGEGEGVKPPEKSFWAKYWMYLIPLGFIIMNAFTQAMNVPPEEQAAGQQSGSQVQQPITQRAPNAAVRRR